MSKLVRVVDLSYTERDGKPIVQVASREQSGDRHVFEVSGTEPYCFIPHDEPIPSVDYITDVEDGYEGYDGTLLQKLTVELPDHVHNNKNDKPCLTEHIDQTTLYEADIPYIRRVSVDYGLTGYIRVPNTKYVDLYQIDTDVDESEVDTIEPRVVMADIEVLPPDGGFGRFDNFVEDAKRPITMISLFDAYTEEYVAIVLDEEGKVDGTGVREYLSLHWEDAGGGSRYQGADISLRRAGDEENLLKAFLDEIEERRPDLLSGWNWVDFDHEYLLNRMGHFDDVDEWRLSDVDGISYQGYERTIDGLPSFDMMSAFCDKMTFSRWRSKALDYVANEELGIGKVDHIDIREEYESNRTRLLAYNIIDVQLLVALDNKHGIHEFFYQLADLASIQLKDTFYELRQVDGFLMSQRDDDEILPTAEETEIPKSGGGLVLTPSSGVKENVGVFDLKSLYPSNIITLNISPETITNDPDEADLICPAMPENEDDVRGKISRSDIQFDAREGMGLQLDEEGLIPKYLRLLFDDRDRMKAIREEHAQSDPQWGVWDNKQYAVKVLMNSFFGVCNNEYWRLSRDGLGDAITGAGRYVLWKGARIAEQMGYDVKYGDTDSIMVQLADPGKDIEDEILVNRGEDMESELNGRMTEVADDFGIANAHPFIAGTDLHGTDRHCLTFEFEKLYKRFIQLGSKKRYAGLPIWKEGQYVDSSKPDIVGFESQRSDVPEITEEVQQEFIRRVLGGQEFDEVSEYLQDIAGGIINGETELSRIGVPGSINKPLEEYPNRPTPRACEYANEYLDKEWSEGDDPWVYFVRKTPPMTKDTDVIALDVYESPPAEFELDRTKHVEKHVEQPLKPFLEEINWDFTELRTGAKTQSVSLGDDGDDNPFTGDGKPEPKDNPFAGESTDDESEEDTVEGALEW